MQSPPLPRTPIPARNISHAVWHNYRCSPSLRDVEDLLAKRGIIVTYETIWNCWSREGSLSPGHGQVEELQCGVPDDHAFDEDHFRFKNR
jgi:hypothetical protein